jgi:hypothetical protein
MHEFGRMTFSTSAWIDGGALLSGVRLVEIEMVTPGAFGLEVHDAAGTVISRGSRANPNGGWSTFDFLAGMNPPVRGGRYRLKLVNEAPGERQVRFGRVSP